MNPLDWQQGMESCLRWISRMMIVVVLTSMPSHSLFADAASDRRARVGLNLFRTFVNADLGLADRADRNNRLPIVMLYQSSDALARDFREQLQGIWPRVQGLATRIEALSLADLQQRLPEQIPAAVFITEPLDDDERQQLVELTVHYQVAVFSPYEGDVEAGILGGLSVTSSVRPTVNLATLKRSHVSLKSFYLNVARTYE